MRVGTPPVVQMAALEAALDVWDAVDINDVRTRSIELSERFREGIKSNCPSLELNSPKNPAHRGSQISFRHPEGYAIVQAAIERGVVGDFRAPDVLRFGITPLYIVERDIDRAISVLADIMAQDLWDQPRHKRRAAVT
jgi:kynureninase